MCPARHRARKTAPNVNDAVESWFERWMKTAAKPAVSSRVAGIRPMSSRLRELIRKCGRARRHTLMARSSAGGRRSTLLGLLRPQRRPSGDARYRWLGFLVLLSAGEDRRRSRGNGLRGTAPAAVGIRHFLHPRQDDGDVVSAPRLVRGSDQRAGGRVAIIVGAEDLRDLGFGDHRRES